MGLGIMNIIEDIEQIDNNLNEINLSIINSISFLIYEIENNDKNDLFILSKLLDEQSLINIINYYNGATIKLPTKLEYKRNLILSLYFYLIEIKGYSFQDAAKIIKDKAGYEIEEHDHLFGKKLKAIKDKLKQRVIQMLEELRNG